jgi:hypothetical protein
VIGRDDHFPPTDDWCTVDECRPNYHNAIDDEDLTNVFIKILQNTTTATPSSFAGILCISRAEMRVVSGIAGMQNTPIRPPWPVQVMYHWQVYPLFSPVFNKNQLGCA